MSVTCLLTHPVLSNSSQLINQPDSFNVMQSDIPSLPFFQPEFGVPASIYCSSSWVKALRPTDADPTDPQNRPLSETRPGEYKNLNDYKYPCS